MTTPRSLADLVARSAAAFPQHIALLDGERALTYAELMEAARALAGELTRAGVGVESVVALDLPPGPRTVVAMVAASLVEAAFMPIDRREPAARRTAMSRAARPAAVLTTDAVVPADGSRLDERLPQRRGRAAYVSFTSGSTGVPKAVVTEQPAIVAYVEHVVSAYGLGPGDRQMQFSSIAFDIAIDEIFSTLAAGATVVHRTEDVVFGGVDDFLDRCQERDVTVLNLPTGLWNRLGADLAARPQIALPPGLRLVVVGGESAQASAVEAWHAAATHPDFAVLNAYGPTEAAVSVTFAALLPGRPVRIGRPIPGTTITLRDGGGEPVADGEAGELVIAGVSVARGYLEHDGGFAEIGGEWCYGTGDLARRDDAGDLEFLGRADTQVKVRGGYRVEPGEVIATLQALPAVRHAHVQALARRSENVLVAFVVPAHGTAADLDVLGVREAIAAALPDWMVPWRIVAVDAIPLTGRGKADEAALAASLPGDDGDAVRADGHDDVRAVVTQAWASVLGQSAVEDDENFFEQGGDSLAALELIETLTRQVGRAPSMADFYRAPTIADLVTALTPDDVANDGVAHDIPTAHHTTGRTLVKMRRAGSERLWCFLPPLSGAVTRYAGLAARLPQGEAVWAMETPAALASQGMTALAAGLADRLLAEGLDEFETIVFSGYSLGGVFAHEVAHHIEARLPARPGGRPAVLALLLDPPDPAEPQISLDDAFDIFVRVGWRITEPVESFVGAEGYDLPAVAAAARRAGTLPSSAADDDVADAWTVYAKNARVLDDYELRPGVARTHVLQCRPELAIPVGTCVSGTHSGSWSTVVPAKRTSLVAVEHFALMEPPHDETVLRWLVDTATTADP